MAPNLLLIVFDTARADHFEPWGGAPGATPTVRALAERGTVFPRAVSPSNWTLPSHASMFTGLLPSMLGLTDAGPPHQPGFGSRPILESLSERVLAEVLRRRGYSTRAISANPWIHPGTGFAVGFEEFRVIRGTRRGHANTLRSQVEWLVGSLLARADDGATQADQIIESWLAEPPGRPFFWFVNLMECHSPFLPPRPYNDLSVVERISAGRDAMRYQTAAGIYEVCAGDEDLPPAARRRVRHLYGRSIRQLDDWLGRVLNRLADRGMLDDTVVVVTSDHGENLGENHLLGHVLSMDDRLINVPLVVAGPGETAAEGLTSLAELPTLLASVLEIDDHPWVENVRPGGFAVSQVAGEVMIQSLEAVANALGVGREAIRRIAAPISAVTDGRFKLVRTPGGDRFFDVDGDPLEERALERQVAAAAGVPVERLASALDQVDDAVPRSAPQGGSTAETSLDLEERLRLLGYI